MIPFGSFITFTALAALTLSIGAGCGGSDDDKTGSSGGGGSSSGGSSSGGSSSGGSSSGGSSSGGSSSGSSGSTSSSSGSSTEKKEMGAQCKESADCKSDFCVFKSGGSLGMCTQTCSDDIDCPGLGYKCVNVSDAPQKVCVPE